LSQLKTSKKKKKNKKKKRKRKKKKQKTTRLLGNHQSVLNPDWYGKETLRKEQEKSERGDLGMIKQPVACSQVERAHFGLEGKCGEEEGVKASPPP